MERKKKKHKTTPKRNNLTLREHRIGQKIGRLVCNVLVDGAFRFVLWLALSGCEVSLFGFDWFVFKSNTKYFNATSPFPLFAI